MKKLLYIGIILMLGSCVQEEGPNREEIKEEERIRMEIIEELEEEKRLEEEQRIRVEEQRIYNLPENIEKRRLEKVAEEEKRLEEENRLKKAIELKAFEETVIQEAYEAKAKIVQLGPVQSIYDGITKNMEGGKYPLYCDDWKSSPFIVGMEKPTKEHIAAFKEILDDQYGNLSDDSEGLATYYCKRLVEMEPAIKEVDCKRAVVGACNGTSFDEIYKEELELIKKKGEINREKEIEEFIKKISK
ncbi:hypothetical protein OAN33_06755 [Flavobacteriales bacterium]|nr:hypothetical protein [Flavobacteriales bacterium]